MSKPDVAILIVVLAIACSLGIAFMAVTNRIKEDIEKPGAANWITPTANLTGTSSGVYAILCIVVILIVIFSKGILWG